MYNYTDRISFHVYSLNLKDQAGARNLNCKKSYPQETARSNPDPSG